MNISLRQLRCFVAVAQSQNFTRAAQSLHTTQSAVSLIIKELEDEVGFRLFDRTTRQVLLSDAGQEFFRLASRLLDEFQTVLRDVSDIGALHKGVVRVGAAEAVACSLMVPAIAAYQKERPGIEVQLVVTLVSSMFSALREGGVDFIVGPDSMRGDASGQGVALLPLARSPLGVWCPPSHPLAGEREVAWRELLRHDLVIPSLDFHTRIAPAVASHLELEEGGVDPFGSALSLRMVSNMTAALSMAQAGLGVTLAADYIRPLATAFGLVGRPLVQPSFERVLIQYSRRGKSLSPAAADFSAFFRGFLDTAEL